MCTHIFSILWILLMSGLNGAFVPPPTNVTVDCQNTKILAKWNYIKQPMETIFIVIPWFEGHPRQACKTTTTTKELDLSDCIWNSGEQFTDTIFVTVTAILGQKRSQNVTSNTLAFNTMKTVNTLCTLDFPPVIVYESDSGATISFQNPLFFYKQLIQARKSDYLHELKFTISLVKKGSINIKNPEGYCQAEEKICEHIVGFRRDVDTCVTIEGMLIDKPHAVKQLKLNQRKECLSNSNVKSVWLISLAALCFLTIIILLAVFIFKKWTCMNQPSALKIPLWTDKSAHMKFMIVPKEDVISPVQECDRAPAASSVQDDSSAGFEIVSNHSSTTYSGLCPYAGNCSSGSSLPSNEEINENSPDFSEDSDCTSSESEEEQMNSGSPYDQPHRLSLLMVDGDCVTGHTEH